MFGENVKRYREKAKLSQAKLAELCGVNASMIGQIESCGKVPNVILGDKIAKKLDVTIDILVNEEVKDLEPKE